MNNQLTKIASLANISAYSQENAANYIDGAPHIKHKFLRELYAKELIQVYSNSLKFTKFPIVLDMGAGEGSVTLPFLELGAHVVAVDLSEFQLKSLSEKSKQYGNRLEIRCQDINQALNQVDEKFDIIVANSFLHHLPDYIEILKKVSEKLNNGGQFFCFQDPLLYRSMSHVNLIFSNISYYSWRLMKGDLYDGLSRYIRRKRGVFKEDSYHDNAEYHVVRDGVDQDCIKKFFEDNGFRVKIIKYFSTQNTFFQRLGTLLKMENTFSIIAQKDKNSLSKNA